MCVVLRVQFLHCIADCEREREQVCSPKRVRICVELLDCFPNPLGDCVRGNVSNSLALGQQLCISHFAHDLEPISLRVGVEVAFRVRVSVCLRKPKRHTDGERVRVCYELCVVYCIILRDCATELFTLGVRHCDALSSTLFNGDF